MGLAMGGLDERDRPQRPNSLSFVSGRWFLNRLTARVTMTSGEITVGCTTASIVALRALLKKHEELFGHEAREIVVQEQ